MNSTIEMTEERVFDAYKGKDVGPYVAIIRGPGDRYALERSFLRIKPVNGEATLPAKDGVYEARDFVAGSKRVRYFQVRDGVAKQLVTPSDEDVLDAVEASADGVWYSLTDGGSDATASTTDVMLALDECQKEIEAMEPLDKEEVLMHLDKVRIVVERL